MPECTDFGVQSRIRHGIAQELVNQLWELHCVEVSHSSSTDYIIANSYIVTIAIQNAHALLHKIAQDNKCPILSSWTKCAYFGYDSSAYLQEEFGALLASISLEISLEEFEKYHKSNRISYAADWDKLPKVPALDYTTLKNLVKESCALCRDKNGNYSS